MTAGVWMVPLVLMAAVVFLWATAWFEDHVAPRDFDPQLPTMKAADAVIADTAVDHQSALDLEDHLANTLDRPAA